MSQFDAFDLSLLIQAAAEDLGAPITGDVRWVEAGQNELSGLTAADRDLIHVATGERIPECVDQEQVVSFFTLQLASDRLVGPLQDGEDVPIAYLEHVYSVHEDSSAGSSVCGDVLDLCLAYLVGRELAVLGPDLS